MKTSFRVGLAAVAIAFTLTAANAAVIFNFVPTTTSALSPGTSGTVELRLQITGSEQVAGVDFVFSSLDISSGLYLASRNTTGTAFPDIFDPSVTTRPDADLDPTMNPSGASLSQSVNDPSTEFLTSSGMPAGGWLIATYTIGVDAGVPNGSYTIVTTPSIWSNPAGTEFTGTQGSFELVIPEPTTWSLLGLGGLAALGANLLRARRKG